MNIGAGSIIFQDLPRINAAIADGTFAHNQALLNAMNHAKTNNSTLHFIWFGWGGFVHSNVEHLYAPASSCEGYEVPNVMIHAFTDGRDLHRQQRGTNYIRRLLEYQNIGVGTLATIMEDFTRWIVIKNGTESRKRTML